MSRSDSLRVYHAARELAEMIIEALREVEGRIPADLRSQLERAANSVAANLAEGMGRRTRDDKLKFLGLSRSSLDEVRHHLRVSVNTKVFGKKVFYRIWNRSSTVQRMSAKLIAYVERE